jgi:hypothetical protein
MSNQELNKEISQKIMEFESLEDVSFPSEWKKTLMHKLDNCDNNSFLKFSTVKLGFFVIFILLINIGLLLNSMLGHKQNISHRNYNLEIISKELLINPVSLNN